MASFSVAPVATKEQSNPISLQFIDTIKTKKKMGIVHDKFTNLCECNDRTLCLYANRQKNAKYNYHSDVFFFYSLMKYPPPQGRQWNTISF